MISRLDNGRFPGWSPGFEAALERLAIAARRPSRSQHAGDVRSRLRGRALEFADYRHYTAGDDPKLVDWRAYSRLDRLYVKQYDEERSRTLTLLVDASASMASDQSSARASDRGSGAGGEPPKGRYARELAAALAWISLSRHEPARAYLLRAGTATALPPATTRAGVAPLFQQLGEAREAGQTHLAAAVRAALRDRAPGTVVLVSDLLDPEWEEGLAALAATGEGVALQVLAPEEWEPPLGEEVELEDAETGELRATRLGPAELSAYRARLEAFLAAVRRRSRQLGLTHVALNTGRPLSETVLRELPAAGVLTP